MKKKGELTYDFSGYATRVGLKCSDGRTIMQDAFQENHGQQVPLVWQHLHHGPENILGHAVLENRKDGVYAFCSLNESSGAKSAREAIRHKDINALSIYANSLVEKQKKVVHGCIREVSLVIAGANKGAYIDNITFGHGDGTIAEDETEAIISVGEELVIVHEEKKDDEEKKDHEEKKEEPEVEDVYETFSEKQKNVIHYMVASILGEVQEDDEDNEDNEVKQSALTHADGETIKDIFESMNEDQKAATIAILAHAVRDKEEKAVKQSNLEGDTNIMKRNIFDASTQTSEHEKNTLSHDAMKQIFTDAQRCGSLKEAFLQHDYGIENIDYLFPDAKTLTPTPSFLKRDTGWVKDVFGAAHKSPFSRIKTIVADLTADEARAKGYVTGSLKVEQVLALLKRVTSPTTVYKKQKLDRDDIVDIVDMDVVAWLKVEMRGMLEEELARAILIGDGRSPASDDKINEDNIRPIYSDEELFTVRVLADADTKTDQMIDLMILARKNYKGSGNPGLYATADIIGDMLLLKDSTGRRLYNTINDLAAALRVSKIVEVPVMEGVSRTITEPEVGVEGEDADLIGIIANMKDYAVGADKGGAINLFDDFDIDYNQYKYLIETRCSGALTIPKAALVIEKSVVVPPLD